MPIDVVKTKDAYFRLLPWPIAEAFKINLEECLTTEKKLALESELASSNSVIRNRWYQNYFRNFIGPYLFAPLETIAKDSVARDPLSMTFNEYEWDATALGWKNVSETIQLLAPRSYESVGRFLSRYSLDHLLTILAFFHVPAHQTLYPEFAGVSTYLLTTAPTRRTAKLMTRAELAPYFEAKDSIVEDPTVITEYPNAFLLGQVSESNIQTWTNAIKNFVATNPTLFDGTYSVASSIEMADVGYDPVPMENLWKKVFQALTLLLAYCQELEIAQVRFEAKFVPK